MHPHGTELLELPDLDEHWLDQFSSTPAVTDDDRGMASVWPCLADGENGLITLKLSLAVANAPIAPKHFGSH